MYVCMYVCMYYRLIVALGHSIEQLAYELEVSIA